MEISTVGQCVLELVSYCQQKNARIYLKYKLIRFSRLDTLVSNVYIFFTFMYIQLI